jgi:hypothetical protein
VLGDICPPRDPEIALLGHMPKDPIEGAGAAGPPDHPQVQPDRHHFRRVRPFAVQPVERVDHVAGEISGATEPVGVEELDVVGLPGSDTSFALLVRP